MQLGMPDSEKAGFLVCGVCFRQLPTESPDALGQPWARGGRPLVPYPIQSGLSCSRSLHGVDDPRVSDVWMNASSTILGLADSALSAQNSFATCTSDLLVMVPMGFV